eukprot:scaffold293411_cov44-Attheya_sp.AAC.1
MLSQEVDPVELSDINSTCVFRQSFNIAIVGCVENCRRQIEPPLVRTTGHGCRHICQECGRVLTIIYDSQPELIWPATGGFDDESIPSNYSDYLGRVIHICCTWKQDWYAIPEDGMPRVKHAS